MLISNCSSLEYNNSFVLCQDITKNRSAKKAKLRSIRFTLSSIVVGPEKVTEISNSATPDTEAYPTKLYNMEDNLPINGRRKFPDEFSSGSPACGKSKRTEDIFIREDENGTRSHNCPLKPELDGERNEDYPDHPTSFDLDIEEVMKNGCNLASEDIPFLYASRESEESESSSVDSDSMKYEVLENQPTTNENSFVHPILQLFRQTKTPSYKRLDEETMAEWEGDSSDEYYDPLIKDPELQKSIVGDESDMEEFEKDSEEENVDGNLTKNEKNKDSMDNKDLTVDVKYSSTELNMINKNGETNSETNTKEYCADYNDKNVPTSNLQRENEGKEEKSESDSPSDFTDLHYADDDSGKEPTLALNNHDDNEEKHMPKSFSLSDCISMNTYYADSDSKSGKELNLNVQDDNNNKPERSENNSEIKCTEKDVLFTDVKNESVEYRYVQDKCRDERDRNGFSSKNDLTVKDSEKNKQKAEECEPEIDSSVKNDSTHCDVLDNSLKIEVTTNSKRVENERNPSIQPTEMNIVKCKGKDESKPDCNCEDELYSETLSITDVGNKMNPREKGIMPEDLEKYNGLVLTDLPVLKSVGKSGIFEPVLTEEQKVASKPRNKFMKFFQSFKKKFEKK